MTAIVEKNENSYEDASYHQYREPIPSCDISLTK